MKIDISQYIFVCSNIELPIALCCNRNENEEKKKTYHNIFNEPKTVTATPTKRKFNHPEQGIRTET